MWFVNIDHWTIKLVYLALQQLTPNDQQVELTTRRTGGKEIKAWLGLSITTYASLNLHYFNLSQIILSPNLGGFLMHEKVKKHRACVFLLPIKRRRGIMRVTNSFDRLHLHCARLSKHEQCVWNRSLVRSVSLDPFHVQYISFPLWQCLIRMCISLLPGRRAEP